MKKSTILAILICFATISQGQNNKRVFTDLYNLTDSLTTLKSIVEDFATEMKNEWKNDSLKIIGQKKFVEISGVVDGITSSFSTIILQPKQLTPAIKTKISSQLNNLYLKMNDFSAFYVRSKIYMTNGSKFGPDPITLVTTLFEIGTKLYDMIKNFITIQRIPIANKFKADCTLVKWDKLPKS